MMFQRLIAGVCIVSLLLVLPATVQAEEPLVDRVKMSIDKGIAFLRKRQEDRGGMWNWENNEFALRFTGGPTCLAMLAMLTCGVKPSDPAIQRALPFVRQLEAKDTYVVALQTMVLAEIGSPRDLTVIQRNVKWLLGGRIYRGGKLEGWSYGSKGNSRADNSNTQYALLGLLYGRQAGVKIEKKDWEEIQAFYIRTQDKTGGWAYGLGESGVRHTMSVAGLCGLYISSLESNYGQQELNEQTGVAAKCAQYAENDAIARGMRWLEQNFKYETTGTSFYNIYGIERVGRLSGQRFIGDHDWYREGCELLTGVKRSALNQLDDGSWKMSGLDSTPTISTAFALLFLSKGRTPVLISKLAYDARPQDRLGWNNKHNDARHLVEYASAELFKKQPLAWQIYDPRMPRLESDKDINEELTNLLQSPILYMNGHKAPDLSKAQIKLLRRYIEEGGFLFAEACCGKPEFVQGFKALMDQVFENESPLVPMPPEHPVWTAHVPIDLDTFYRGWPADYRVQCIERGCKTVVVFSPVPLAGYWEENRYIPAKPGFENRGELAFRFAGNVIAYATGLEMPKPRLTKAQVLDVPKEDLVSRRMLKLSQLRHDGDWHPAPQAMRNLAAHLKDVYRLDVSLNKKELRMTDEDIFQYKVMYMHGRRAFTIADEQLKNVRDNLATGGLLFADACCGSKEFDNAFREFMKKLYPESKFERIPLDDELFSEKLSGRAITTVRCRTEKADGSAEAEFQEVQPLLEGIKIDGRWVVIYSRYDLGCALEKHKSSACKGHDYESALRLASACVLYALKK